MRLERGPRGIVARARGRDVVPTFDALRLGPHACWQIGPDRDDARGFDGFGWLDVPTVSDAFSDGVKSATEIESSLHNTLRVLDDAVSESVEAFSSSSWQG